MAGDLDAHARRVEHDGDVCLVAVVDGTGDVHVLEELDLLLREVQVGHFAVDEDVTLEVVRL